jgi:hypothetical protein
LGMGPTGMVRSASADQEPGRSTSYRAAAFIDEVSEANPAEW